jgi:hypothetical protein
MNHNSTEQGKKVYEQAKEIYEVAVRLADYIKDEAEQHLSGYELEHANLTTGFILEDAVLIPGKIMGAESVALYDLKMENAALIRASARDISARCSALKMMNFGSHDYLDLLRREVETFRILFAEWVKTFDPSKYIIDRWGLFNPPGINYDDPENDNEWEPDDEFDDD